LTHFVEFSCFDILSVYFFGASLAHLETFIRIISHTDFVPPPQKPSLGNSGSLLRMLVTVDSKPTRLSEQSIATLGHHLSEYLMDNVQVSILPKTD